MLILEYHSINSRREDALSVAPDVFQRQIEYLMEHGYRMVSLDRIAQRAAAGSPHEGAPEAAITFDDGYRDNFDVAFPLLTALRVPATVFLALDYVGTNRPFPWDRLPDPSQSRALTWEMAGTMVAGGLFTFGSHTSSHPDLTRLTQEEAWREIHGSRERLADRLGHPVTAFCYPYSRTAGWIKALVDRAGYTHACRTGAHGSDVFDLPRVGVYRHTGWKEFRFKVSPLGRRLQSRQGLRALRTAAQAVLGRVRRRAGAESLT